MKKHTYSIVLTDTVVQEVDRLAAQKGTNRSTMMNQILADYFSCKTPEKQMASVFSLIEQQMQESLAAIKRHPGVVLLLIYPFLFQPLEDVYICNVTEWIGKFLNNYLLHWCDGSRLF